MAKIERNRGQDSRSLLGRAEHPRNVFTRLQQLEAGQGVQFGGVYGGGDPTQFMPNPVPLIVSATPTVTYIPPPGRRQHSLAIALVVAYDPPEDFRGLQAHIYATSGHPGFDHVTQPRADTTRTWLLTDLGFVLGATYAVELRAITDRGVGRWGDPFTGIFFNVGLTAPNPPRNLAINTSVGSSGWGWDPDGAWVALMWDPPLYPEGTRDPDVYVLDVTLTTPPSGADAFVRTIEIPGGSDGYILRGLVVDPPTQYELALYAVEGGVRSATATTLSITTQYTGLPAPTFPTPYYTFGTEPDSEAEGWVRFDWNSVTNAVDYVVEGSENGGATSYDVPGSPTEATDIVEHKIPMGTTRHYRVAARDSRGRVGTWSDWKACALTGRVPVSDPPPTGWAAYNPKDPLRGMQIQDGSPSNFGFLAPADDPLFEFFEGQTVFYITGTQPQVLRAWGPKVWVKPSEIIVVGGAFKLASATNAPSLGVRWDWYDDGDSPVGGTVMPHEATGTTSWSYGEARLQAPATAVYGRPSCIMYDGSGSHTGYFSYWRIDREQNTARLADDSVSSAKIQGEAVTNGKLAPAAVDGPKLAAYALVPGKSDNGFPFMENPSLEKANQAGTMPEGFTVGAGTVTYRDIDTVGGTAGDGERYLRLGGGVGTHRVVGPLFMWAYGRTSMSIIYKHTLSTETGVTLAGVGLEFYDEDKVFISRSYAVDPTSLTVPSLGTTVWNTREVVHSATGFPTNTVYVAVFGQIEIASGSATLDIDAFAVGLAGHTMRLNKLLGSLGSGQDAQSIEFASGVADAAGAFRWPTHAVKTASKTANFTADGTAGIYLCDPSGGSPGSSFTATLPTPDSTNSGRIYTFQKTDTGTNKVYVNGTGIPNYPLVLPSQSVTVACDGSNWRVIATSVLALERNTANNVWVSERDYHSLYTADASWVTFSASSAPHRRRAAPSPHKWLCEAIRWSFRPNGTNTLGNTWTLQQFTESNTLGGTAQGSTTVVGYAGSTWHTVDVVPSSPVWDFSTSSYYTIGWEVVKSGSAGDLDVMDVQAILRRVYD